MHNNLNVEFGNHPVCDQICSTMMPIAKWLTSMFLLFHWSNFSTSCWCPDLIYFSSYLGFTKYSRAGHVGAFCLFNPLSARLLHCVLQTMKREMERTAVTSWACLPGVWFVCMFVSLCLWGVSNPYKLLQTAEPKQISIFPVPSNKRHDSILVLLFFQILVGEC